jgi:diguanylate cyclase (GGDEF)-like protein/PAS domain S-box-containing protein
LNGHISEMPVEGRCADLAEQRYRWLVDHSPFATCVHADGRHVYVNDALVRKMGAESADQLLGRSILDFVHPDSVAAIQAHIAARRQEGDTTVPLEMVIFTLDGTPREVEATAVRTQWQGRPAHQVVFRDLTAQKATETSLRFQAALVDHVSDAIVAITLTGIVTSWNPAAEAIYRRSAKDALGLPVADAVGAALDPAAIVADGGVVRSIHHTADGAALAVRVCVSRMAGGYVVLCADQTPLRRAERHFQTIVDSLQDGVVVIAADGTVESVNPAALEIVGMPATGVDAVEFAKAEAIPIYDGAGQLLSDHQRPVLSTITSSPRRGCIYGFDRLDDRRRVWVSVSWSPLDPTDPARSPVLISFTDITDQHNTHRRLVHQATHDLVTGLPNRARVLALITDAIESDEHRLGAVLFIDLDKFKSINDALGHHAGDTVLQLAAQRLRQALRSDDVVGRVGGDEFVALLTAPVEPTEAAELAARLHAALSEPIVVASDRAAVSEVTGISASIGIVTVAPDERRDAAAILHDADFAMYQAKSVGPPTRHFG